MGTATPGEQQPAIGPHRGSYDDRAGGSPPRHRHVDEGWQIGQLPDRPPRVMGRADPRLYLTRSQGVCFNLSMTTTHTPTGNIIVLANAIRNQTDAEADVVFTSSNRAMILVAVGAPGIASIKQQRVAAQVRRLAKRLGIKVHINSNAGSFWVTAVR